MIKVVPFIYEDLDDLYANTYILIDDNNGCVVIDPAKDYPGLIIVEISLRATNAGNGHIMRYDAGVEEFLSLIEVVPLVLIYAEQFKIRSLSDPLIDLESCCARLAVNIHLCLHRESPFIPADFPLSDRRSAGIKFFFSRICSL